MYMYKDTSITRTGGHLLMLTHTCTYLYIYIYMLHDQEMAAPHAYV